MPTETVSDVDPHLTDIDAIEACATRAVRRALKMHKALEVPIVIQRDGKMITVPPEEIVIPVEHAG